MQLELELKQNLPVSEALSPQQIVSTIDELITTHRGDFERWGLGTYLR